MFGFGYANNNYGIGTTFPINSLDISGNMSIGPYFNNYIAPPNGLIIQGNVGIGKTNPNFNLDVNGTINAINFIGSINASNITSGTLLNTCLPLTGIVSGTYGSTSQIPIFNVGLDGRLNSINNTNISINTNSIIGLSNSAIIDTTNASNITTGTLNLLRFPTSGIASGIYGSNSNTSIITVDTYGRLTNITNNIISITCSQVSGLSNSAIIDTTNASNIITGTLNSLRLPNTSVIPGSYGTASNISSLSINSDGRITNASNIPIAINSTQVSGLSKSAIIDTTNASNITTGTISSSIIPHTSVTSGSYGNASNISSIIIGTDGRITNASNVSIAILSSQVSGLTSSATIDTTNASNITSGTLNYLRLPSSGVSIGTYGSCSHVSTIIVDNSGRITSAANTAISISSTAVSGLSNSAIIDTTNASNILTGILSSSRLPTSGVSIGTYGSASNVATISVDTYGRITNINSINIAISSSQVSNLSASATIDTTNANNITTGILHTSRLPISGVTSGLYGSASNIASINVDTFGRILSISNVAISISASNVSGLTTSATTDTTNAYNITTGILPAARIPNTTVISNTYGSATNVATFTVGSDGRLTGASTIPISISYTAISGLSSSAIIDTTNASNILSGTLSAARLSPTGISAGTYGSSSSIPSITVGSDGRITSISGNAIHTSIPIINVMAKYNSVPINISNNINTIITFDSSDSMSQGNTGILYNTGYFSNSSGSTIVVIVSYMNQWVCNTTCNKATWIQTNYSIGRYAQSEIISNTDGICNTGCATLVIPNGSGFYLYCWQNSDSTVTISNNNMTNIQITRIQ